MSKPFIPWMGGKSRLADKILPLFPDHKCYVEVFAGAAALYFRKDPVKAEVLNDLNGDLVNLYRVVQYHLEEFVRQFKWALSSRQLYEWEKLKTPETLTDIQRAARFYYLQKLAFGGRLVGQTYGTATTTAPSFNLLRFEEELSAAHLRLVRTNIEQLDWSKCVSRYDRAHTLFYLDPPYWDTAGYGVEFGINQYEKMADLAKSCKGKMVISVNDHPEMRRIFRDFRTKRVPITYTVGKANNRSKSYEMIIMNW